MLFPSSTIPMDTTLPPKQLVHHNLTNYTVSSLRWEAISAPEMQQLSVTEVAHGSLYDQSGKPMNLGLHDPRLGPQLKTGSCPTCREPFETCPGHFGYIDFPMPVFHVGYFKHMVNVLGCVCKRCSAALLDEDAKLAFLGKGRRADAEGVKLLFKKILADSKKIKVCPACGSRNGLVKKGTKGPYSLVHEVDLDSVTDVGFLGNSVVGIPSDSTKLTTTLTTLTTTQNSNKTLLELNPISIYQILSQITPNDAEMLTIPNPVRLLLSAMPVPPSCIRPSVRLLAQANEDDLTIELRKLASLNVELRRGVASGEQFRNLYERWYEMQGCAAVLVNSDLSTVVQAYPRDSPVRSLVSRLKGKEGRFRMNLSGKRVNFTGRTVISPDPNVEIGEVVVPIHIARKLTFPEVVNDLNIEKMRKLVVKGNSGHPGALYVRFRGGTAGVASTSSASAGVASGLTSSGGGGGSGGGRSGGPVGVLSTKSLTHLPRHIRIDIASKLTPGDIIERHLSDGDYVLFNRQPSLHKLSIMCHRAKVLPDRTFRFNECCTTPYNADYDGDEMNIHFPQTVEARAEAKTLMTSVENMITPKSGEPIISATQDFITSAWLLTQRDTFLNRGEFCQAVAMFTNAAEKVDVPTPAVLKPVELWTGKQVMNVLLRPNKETQVAVNLAVKEKNYVGGEVFCPNDGFVLIYNSEVLAGNIGKKVIGGGAKPGLFFVLIRDNSSSIAAACMARVARLSARWIGDRGWTIGIDDVSPSRSILEFKEKVTLEKVAFVETKIKEFERGVLALKPGCNAEQTLEALINGELGSIRNLVGEQCEKTLPRFNKPRLMAQCGSKGSAINLSQMMLCLGQQNVNGQRIQDGFVHRTLPHFAKNSKSPDARGFVRNSFCSGLLPYEFFFHTMGGREGLVDTAVKTADTGYMQRKLMKALEDLSLKYDMTVRTSSGGSIVQFVFGDDGLNPGMMEGRNKPLELSATLEHVRRVIGAPAQVGAVAGVGNSNPAKAVMYLEPDEYGAVAAVGLDQLRRVIEGLSPLKNLDSAAFCDDVAAFVQSKAEELRQELEKLDEGEAGQAKLRLGQALTHEQLTSFIELCGEKYRRALVQPGEAVGAVAAQSIGEPATQMTLKTFHFAGVASMNVTLGVPRIKEIINAARNISTPIITCSLVNEYVEEAAKYVKAQIERTTLADICKHVKLVLDAHEAYVEVKLDIEAMEARQLTRLTLDEIRARIIDEGSRRDGAFMGKLVIKEKCVEVVGGDKLVIRPGVGGPGAGTGRGEKDSLFYALHVLKETLPNVVVSGMRPAKRAVVNKQAEKSGKIKYTVLVEGYGMREAMNMEGVDGSRTASNHIAEIQAVLGIEAARRCIMTEIQTIMTHHGMLVDHRHIHLLGDCMTNRGEVLGINRFGITKMRHSTLMLASFEKTSDHLFDAAVHQREDEVAGVSDAIIMGNSVSLGTGLFKIMYEVPEEELADMRANRRNPRLLAGPAEKRKRPMFTLLVITAVVQGNDWLETGLAPTEPAVVPSTPAFGEVRVNYDVDTDDIEMMTSRLIERLGVSVGRGEDLAPEEVAVKSINQLSGSSCSDYFEDPASHPAPTPAPAVSWTKWESLLWTNDAELEEVSLATSDCVSRTNTSLIWNSTYLMPAMYLTGTRNSDNTELFEVSVWFAGPVYYSAVLVAYEKYPVVGTRVNFTELGIIAPVEMVSLYLQHALPEDYVIPVCPRVTFPKAGCFETTFTLHTLADPAITSLTPYEARYYVVDWPQYFKQRASDSEAQFNVTLPPSVALWPSFVDKTAGTSESQDAWEYVAFPQHLWRKQDPECVEGVACEPINISPSERYAHTALLYRSWSFEVDVKPHPTLCRLNPDDENDCEADCLTNTQCMAPPQSAGTWKNTDYFASVSTSKFWAQTEFLDDDGLDYPFTELQSATCPPNCCGSRRLCSRTHDELGRKVPYDRLYMLMFGGKTRERRSIEGQDLYLYCDDLLATFPDLDESLRSCLEYQSEELWRYDTVSGVWDFIKPQTTLDSSGTPMGYPVGRFSHAASVVTVSAEKDPDGYKRKYMFIFGGLGTNCINGICADMWRFEIPWAPKSYWPSRAGVADWQRGAIWVRMKDCPFGGRYGHQMQATSSGDFIFVFGGHVKGGFLDEMLMYRVISDIWERQQTRGYRYFTRTVVDYLLQQKTTIFTDISQFMEDRPAQDQLGPQTTRSTDATDQYPSQQPVKRADHVMVVYDKLDETESDSVFSRVAVIGGFRTYDSPYPGENGFPYPTYPYYLDDCWTYDTFRALWTQIYSMDSSDKPKARRGAAAVTFTLQSGEVQVLLFGGHHQDTLYDDLWLYNLGAAKSNRQWTRIDPYIRGIRPPGLAFHSVVYDNETSVAYVFGGLRWWEANLAISDALRDNDRRCFKQAKDLTTRFCDPLPCSLERALNSVETGCEDDPEGFCCDSIDAARGASSLDRLSTICKLSCQGKAFTADFEASFGEGVWIFRPTKCLNDCSGHGSCVMSNCVCKPGYYGSDCSMPLCPGSVCFTDPESQQQHCTFCSQHGRCLNGQCKCESGWGGNDCSAATCVGNCSSTPVVTKGVCVSDFPVNQCVCSGKYSGRHCETELCLNLCSGHGTCVDGSCQCETFFYGPDCSLYVPEAASFAVSLTIALLCAIASLLVGII